MILHDIFCFNFNKLYMPTGNFSGVQNSIPFKDCYAGSSSLVNEARVHKGPWNAHSTFPEALLQLTDFHEGPQLSYTTRKVQK